MAAKRGPKTGVNSNIYRNAASGATKHSEPDWVEIDHVRDAVPAQPWELSPADIRASRVKLYHQTQKEVGFTAMVRCDNVDEGYIALKDAAENGKNLDLLVLDGPLEAEGNRGFRGFFCVSETGQDQSIGNVLYSAFDFKAGFGVDDDGKPYYPQIAVTGPASAVTYFTPSPS